MRVQVPDHPAAAVEVEDHGGGRGHRLLDAHRQHEALGVDLRVLHGRDPVVHRVQLLAELEGACPRLPRVRGGEPGPDAGCGHPPGPRRQLGIRHGAARVVEGGAEGVQCPQIGPPNDRPDPGETLQRQEVGLRPHRHAARVHPEVLVRQPCERGLHVVGATPVVHERDGEARHHQALDEPLAVEGRRETVPRPGIRHPRDDRGDPAARHVQVQEERPLPGRGGEAEALPHELVRPAPVGGGRGEGGRAVGEGSGDGAQHLFRVSPGLL